MLKRLTITINNPEKVSNDLSDLLCWWEGFKMGLKIGECSHFIVAENGIYAVRELNIKIKDEMLDGKNNLSDHPL